MRRCPKVLEASGIIGQFELSRRSIWRKREGRVPGSIRIVVVSEIIVIVVIHVPIVIVFGTQIDLDGIESDDNKVRTAFVAGNKIALLGIGVNINFFLALWANCSRHYNSTSQNDSF